MSGSTLAASYIKNLANKTGWSDFKATFTPSSKIKYKSGFGEEGEKARRGVGEVGERIEGGACEAKTRIPYHCYLKWRESEHFHHMPPS